MLLQAVYPVHYDSGDSSGSALIFLYAAKFSLEVSDTIRL